MMQVPGGNESQQVLLQVRFAEVNRRVLKEIGLNLIVNRQGWAARATTQQFPRHQSTTLRIRAASCSAIS